MKINKTILVTGGAGFIGSNYLNKFVKKYENEFIFVNVDSLTYAGNLKNIEVGSFKNYFFEKTDIRDAAKVEKIFIEYKPTDIINFAAETHVDFSIENPEIFIETNVSGVNNLLALSRKYKIRRFHQISTDEVYGELAEGESGFREADHLCPSSPYSASKAAADLLVNAYRRTFGLDVVITRSSNNFGPNQDVSKFMPKFIASLIDNKKVPLYARGLNVRDWIYVEDNIDAIDLVFRNGRSGEIYNIGGNCEKSNIEIARMLLKLLEKNESYIEYVPDRLGHDFRYALDISKVRNELGWSPKHDFEEAIEDTIKFYKDLRK